MWISAGVTAKQFDLLVRSMQQVRRTASASDTPKEQGKLAPYTCLQSVVTLHCQLSCKADSCRLRWLDAVGSCFMVPAGSTVELLQPRRMAAGCGYGRAARRRTAQSSLYNMHNGAQGGCRGSLLESPASEGLVKGLQALTAQCTFAVSFYHARLMSLTDDDTQ